MESMLLSDLMWVNSDVSSCDQKNASFESVCEIYSPPRVEPVSRQWGFAPGQSLDLTTQDDTGKAWDFTDPKQRQKALELVEARRPLLVIGSPMCRMFSVALRRNIRKMGRARYEKELRAAVDHLLFCIQIYELQVSSGRYFLHEHPAGARSWHLP